MKRLLQTLVLILATQVVSAQYPCLPAFTYNYDGVSLLYLNDLSYNVDSTAINVVNWSWTINGGGLAVTATGANPVVQVGTNPGWVLVCLTINTATGCTSTTCDTLNLGNTPLPCNASFGYYGGGFMNPLNYTFTDYSTGGNPAAGVNSWNWVITNNLGNTIYTSSQQNPSFTFPANGMYLVCLTITADSSCTSTDCQDIYVMDSTQNNCYIYVIPEITNVSAIGATDGMIDLNVYGGTPPYTYLWNNGAVTQDLIGIGAGFYTLIINQGNATCLPQTFTFEVTQQISGCNANFTFSSGGFFNPFEYSFTDLSSGGIPGIGVNQWYWVITNSVGNTIFTSSVQNPSFTFPTAAYNYYNVCLTITADSSCTDTYCQYVYVIDSTQNNCYITVVPEIYNVSVIGASDGMIDLTVSGANSPFTYAWNNGAVTEDIAGLSSGVYTLAISQSNPACPVQNYTFQIFEPYQNPPIDTLFTTAIDSCLNFVVDTFYVSGIGLYGNTVNVTWVFMGSGMTASFVTSYTFSQYGNYMVTLTFNCTKNLNNYMSYINVSPHLGINEPVAESLKLYPNPASDNILLDLPFESVQASIRIFNVTGKMVKSLKANGTQNSIDVSSFPSGIYLIRVENQAGKVISTNFIKQ